jgi:predicted acyltransferase (DUF342 family)
MCVHILANGHVLGTIMAKGVRMHYSESGRKQVRKGTKHIIKQQEQARETNEV